MKNIVTVVVFISLVRSNKLHPNSNVYSEFLLLFQNNLRLFGIEILATLVFIVIINYNERDNIVGVGMNGTEPMSMEEIEESEPSSIILVVVQMAGRMANVVGTIKLFKVTDQFHSYLFIPF